MAANRECRSHVVWRFSDGKPGHDNQSLGLMEALEAIAPLDSYTLTPLSNLRALAGLLTGRFPMAGDLPPPDLIVGAGHRTHLSLLAARRAKGGKVVVLMRPSLPLACFDLCLIPEHDKPPVAANVLATRGALNRIRPSKSHDPGYGLFLIGGPSAHFDWDEINLLRQIGKVLEANADVRWTLTTSRRTPADFLQRLSGLPMGNLTVVSFVQTGSAWLPEQLAKAAQVWVTADSVSMVYEALTAGAAVGMLEVPKRKDSRVAQGLDNLIRAGLVTPFSSWQDGQSLQAPSQSIDEAARCAEEIRRRWFRKDD